jgi:hypothetical protein
MVKRMTCPGAVGAKFTTCLSAWLAAIAADASKQNVCAKSVSRQDQTFEFRPEMQAERLQLAEPV